MNADRPVFQPESRWGWFRRHSRWFLRENFYRDFWLLAITFVIWQGALALEAQQHRITDGRRFAVNASCAVESAVAQAGYEVITRGQGPENPFTRFLEQHGYPPPKVRLVQAQMAGRLYVRSIAQQVVSRVGSRGATLINPDGSLNCLELARLAAVSPPS